MIRLCSEEGEFFKKLTNRIDTGLLLMLVLVIGADFHYGKDWQQEDTVMGRCIMMCRYLAQIFRIVLLVKLSRDMAVEKSTCQIIDLKETVRLGGE
jgi:hypothetical protein